MIEVKNLLFQPLSLHTRSGHGLHLGPRERLRLPDDEVSAEMEAAARRGAIVINAECGTRNVEPEERNTEREASEDSNIPHSEFRFPNLPARTTRKRRN